MLEDRLSVLGTATGELAPDRIEWALVVRERDADSRVAFDRCVKRLRELAEALSAADVTTGTVTTEPEFHERGYRPTGRHLASAALIVVVPLAQGGEIAAAAMAAGADELHGPKALLPDTAATLDALFEQAVLAARVTAERMAAAAGRSLGRVVSVRDPRADESDGRVHGFAASGGGHGDGPPVIARPQRLSVAVAVVFELGDPRERTASAASVA
jgi:uncharacterized protein YggE